MPPIVFFFRPRFSFYVAESLTFYEPNKYIQQQQQQQKQAAGY